MLMNPIDLSGTWSGSVTYLDESTARVNGLLRQAGEKVAGSIKIPNRGEVWDVIGAISEKKDRADQSLVFTLTHANGNSPEAQGEATVEEKGGHIVGGYIEMGSEVPSFVCLILARRYAAEN